MPDPVVALEAIPWRNTAPEVEVKLDEVTRKPSLLLVPPPPLPFTLMALPLASTLCRKVPRFDEPFAERAAEPPTVTVPVAVRLADTNRTASFEFAPPDVEPLIVKVVPAVIDPLEKLIPRLEFFTAAGDVFAVTFTDPESLVIVVFTTRIPELELLPLPPVPETETFPLPAAWIVAELISRPRLPEPKEVLLAIPITVI